MPDNCPDWLQQKLAFEGRYTAIPELTKTGLKNWILYGIRPGHFVEAVLRNDLHDAFDRADADNIDALLLIVQWLHNEAPVDVWLAPSRYIEAEDQTLRDAQRKLLYTFRGYLTAAETETRTHLRSDNHVVDEDDGGPA